MQLVSILMDNAMKYTPQDGKAYVNLSKEHHSVIIKFKNIGELLKLR